MSPKYRAVNAYGRSVGHNVIEKEKGDKYDRTNHNSKSFLNGLFFDNNEKTYKTNVTYFKKRTEPLSNEHENENTNTNFSDALKQKESLNYRKYGNSGITNSSEEITKADLKRKRINEIIEKYRNRMKIFHDQNVDSPENGKDDMKRNVSNEVNRSEMKCSRKYGEIGENNQLQLNEAINEKEMELYSKGGNYENCEERNMARNTTVNNKSEKEVNIYVNKKWEDFIGKSRENEMGKQGGLYLKEFKQERETEEKYQIMTDLHKNQKYNNFVKIGNNGGVSDCNADQMKDDLLHPCKEKKTFNLSIEEREKYDSLPLQKKKRIHLDIERAKQIDYKKEEFFKSQRENKMENYADEERKIEMQEEQNQETYPFRRFFYDSIAFDEFKIKDKFKEIEQIEQSIRAKNLLSNASDINEIGKTENKKKNNENKEKVVEIENSDGTPFVKRTKEKDIKTDDDKMENTSGKENYKSVYREVFHEEPTTEEKKERDDVSGKKTCNIPTHSENSDERKWENKIVDNKFQETNLCREDMSEKKTFRESLYMNKLYEENKMGKQQNESNLKNQNMHPNKKMEQNNGHYKNIINLDKSDLPIAYLGNQKDEGQLLEEYKSIQTEKKNDTFQQYVEKSNANDTRKNHPFSFDEKDKNIFFHKKTEHSKYVKENNLKEEEKSTGGEASYYNEDKPPYLFPAKTHCKKRSSRINRKSSDNENPNTHTISLFTKKIEEKEKKENDRHITKKKVLETQTKNDSLENKSENNLMREVGKKFIKENIRCFGENDTIDDLKEVSKFPIKEKKKHEFLFPNSYTQDRKLERTIKTAYTEQFNEKEFKNDKEKCYQEQSNYVENCHVSNGSEKFKIEESDRMKITKVQDLLDQREKRKEKYGVDKYEKWKTSKYQNIADIKDKGNMRVQELNNAQLGEIEQPNKNINKVLKMNQSRNLNKSVNVHMFNEVHDKAYDVLNKTYNNTLHDSSQNLENIINRGRFISEKYEKDYKFLEQLRKNLENEKQENHPFFSINYSQTKNKILPHKKFPNGLYVTYSDHIGTSHKSRSSIIRDMLFDDSDNEKEGEMRKRRGKDLEKTFAKDKQGSIERIKRELEVIKRYKDGKEIESVDEGIIRDEIYKKRKLYEEKIRKEFEEKIQLRRQMFEQKEGEKEMQILKDKIHRSGDMTENEQNEQKEKGRERWCHENEKKRKEKRKKNIFDDYSSDGSYYQQMYRNLYDDEYNKKLKNYFHDVSDNLYLQDCSDIFFDSIKKTPSNDVTLSNSFDTDLISLGKIKFDEFDYNYLNRRGKSNSSKSQQEKKTVINTTPKSDSSKGSSYAMSPLEKPRFEFSDISEKESLKCENNETFSVVAPKEKTLDSLLDEREDNILCKLVKRKTAEKDVSHTKKKILEKNNIWDDSRLKEMKEVKVAVNEVVMNKEIDSENNNNKDVVYNEQEELNSKLFGKSCNNIGVDINEMEKKELPKECSMDKTKLTENKNEIRNNSLKKETPAISKRIVSGKSTVGHATYKISALEKANLEKMQEKKIPLKRKVSRSNSINNPSNNDNSGNDVVKLDFINPMSKEVRAGNKQESDTQNDVSQEQAKEVKIKAIEEDVKNIKTEEVKKKTADVVDVLKESSSSSTKTIPKINILQNEENYIPLDLALNFVMDNQKMKKQVKKETKRPNKKKTFTQWVMEERKKRLKNNLPIDI